MLMLMLMLMNTNTNTNTNNTNTNMDDVKRLTALAVAIGVILLCVSLPRGEFEGRWLPTVGGAGPDLAPQRPFSSKKSL